MSNKKLLADYGDFVLDDEGLNTLLEAIEDKLLSNGYISKHLESGSLETFTILIHTEEDYNYLQIHLTIEDRDGDLTADESDYIEEELQDYITEKGLEESFTELGYDLEDFIGGVTAFNVQYNK